MISRLRITMVVLALVAVGSILPGSPALAESPGTSGEYCVPAEWTPGADNAIARVLGMIGLPDSDSQRSRVSVSQSAHVGSVTDTTTPFLSDTIDASRVFIVEARVYWPPEWAIIDTSIFKSSLYDLRAIVDSATGRLYELRLSSGEDVDIELRSGSATEKIMLAVDNQQLVGFPKEPPRLSLIEAVKVASANGVFVGPVESGNLIMVRYVHFQSDDTDGSVPVWEIYSYAPIDLGNGQLTHLRNVIDSNTGEAVCRTSNVP